MTTDLMEHRPCAPTAPQIYTDATQSPEFVARRFCGQFMAVLLMGLVAVASINAIVNPFAQYSARVFRPVVQTSRAAKMELFDNLCRTRFPDALILGSSRVTKFEPDYAAQLTGLTFFNAGVNYGSGEDFLAWFRYFQDRTGHAPRMILLGLDAAGFSERVKPDARLVGCRPLAHEIADVLSIEDQIHPYTELLAWSQFRQSLRSLGSHALRRVTDPEEHYRADGVLVYDRREAEIAADTYDFAAALAYTSHEYLTKFQDFGSVSATQLRMLARLLAECQAAGTAVVAFYTTTHPKQLAELRARASYDEHFADLDSQVRSICEQYRVALTDLREVSRYGGDPTQFVDGIHPREANTRRMLDLIFRDETDCIQSR